MFFDFSIQNLRIIETHTTETLDEVANLASEYGDLRKFYIKKLTHNRFFCTIAQNLAYSQSNTREWLQHKKHLTKNHFWKFLD